MGYSKEIGSFLAEQIRQLVAEETMSEGVKDNPYHAYLVGKGFKRGPKMGDARKKNGFTGHHYTHPSGKKIEVYYGPSKIHKWSSISKSELGPSGSDASGHNLESLKSHLGDK